MSGKPTGQSAGLDGSPAEQLTHGPGTWQCSPAWSPDGTRIAFDSQAADGSWHVWTISANGRPPHQVTTDAGSQVRPSWSRDGRWLYFVWIRDHDRDVWRTRGPGAPTERVTQGGSTVTAARESIDGTGVFYKRESGDGPLLLQPLACLVISPNGRTLLYSRLAIRETDLMVIEHFR